MIAIGDPCYLVMPSGRTVVGLAVDLEPGGWVWFAVVTAEGTGRERLVREAELAPSDPGGWRASGPSPAGPRRQGIAPHRRGPRATEGPIGWTRPSTAGVSYREVVAGGRWHAEEWASGGARRSVHDYPSRRDLTEALDLGHHEWREWHYERVVLDNPGCLVTLDGISLKYDGMPSSYVVEREGLLEVRDGAYDWPLHVAETKDCPAGAFAEAFLAAAAMWDMQVDPTTWRRTVERVRAIR